MNRKILIIDAYHDSDKGGVGILHGLLDAIDAINENYDISVMYRWGENTKEYETANRHTSNIYKKISFYGHPLPHSGDTTKSILKKYYYRFILPFIILFNPEFYKSDSIKALIDADIIISKGGHFYHHRKNSLLSNLSLFHKYYILLLCRRMNKKYCIFAQTFGPFNTYLSKRITKFVLDKAFYIGVREVITKKILEEIGLTNITVVPDTAFYFRKKKTVLANVDSIPSEKYVAITARYWTYDVTGQNMSDKIYENYVDCMAKCSDFIISRYKYKIALVVHTKGEHSTKEDDEKPIRDIYKKIQNKNETYILNSDFSPYELLNIYNNAQFLIGTRLHSVIFTLIQSKPVIAVAYTHKTEGIMNMMGLNQYYIDIDKINYKDVEKLVKKLTDNYEHITAIISENVKTMRAQIILNLKNAINKGFELCTNIT